MIDKLNFNSLDKKYNEACEIFGKEIVEEVTETLSFIGDPDTLYASYEDHEQYTHMECIAFLYFEE